MLLQPCHQHPGLLMRGTPALQHVIHRMRDKNVALMARMLSTYSAALDLATSVTPTMQFLQPFQRAASAQPLLQKRAHQA